jgi:iron complex outermembrane receptor protein
MKTYNRTKSHLSSLAISSVIVLASSPAWSQDESDTGFIEEIITTGTRTEGTSPLESLSPVDVLAGEALANQGAFDITDGLTKISPSLNTQRFPIADGTAFIRPVTLRNLAPDHTARAR